MEKRAACRQMGQLAPGRAAMPGFHLVLFFDSARFPRVDGESGGDLNSPRSRPYRSRSRTSSLRKKGCCEEEVNKRRGKQKKQKRKKQPGEVCQNLKEFRQGRDPTKQSGQGNSQ